MTRAITQYFRTPDGIRWRADEVLAAKSAIRGDRWDDFTA
jgi:hypothetical protein